MDPGLVESCARQQQEILDDIWASTCTWWANGL